MRRSLLLATLAVSVAMAADARAQSSQLTPPRIGGYSSVIDPMTTTVESSATGGSTATIMATGLGTVTVGNPDFLQNPAGPQTYNNATFILTANTMSAASTNVFGPNRVSFHGGFRGSFSIMQGGVNILSSMFTNSGAISQVASGGNPSPVIFNVDPSDFDSQTFLPTFEEEFSLRFSGGVPLLMARGGAFQDFNADGFTGDFNVFVIPEPATLAMVALGVIALPLAVGVFRRRRPGRPA